jgi:hypothetical protein
MFSRKLIMLFFLSGLIFFSECSKPVKEMMVFTGTATEITINSAKVSGSIIDLGEGITDYGHCYAKSPNVSYTGLKTSLGVPGDTGLFISKLHDLTGGTTYYIKAYVKNGNKYTYGEEKYFSTNGPSLPVVSTTIVSEITSNSAVCGGEISSDGGAIVTARGVCWSTTGIPTISDYITSDGTGTGIFPSDLTGLKASTKYHVRAYATNIVETAYGVERIFDTTEGPGIPTITTTDVTDVTTNSAISGGNISDDGGAPVTERGVCWSISARPTTADNKTTDGNGTGSFTSTINGLTSGSKYHLRAYAKNSAGTAYGSDKSFTTL